MEQKSNSNTVITLIAQAFKSAVEESYDFVDCGNGPAKCDLSGDILKRRKASVLSHMDVVRARYREKYPALDIDTEWVRLCSTLFFSVNQFDEAYHFSLAAAIWLLDAFCENCSIADMERYLPADNGNDLLLPDFVEPRYDAATIHSALHLILSRDGNRNQSRRLISSAAARRRGPVEWHVPEEEKKALTIRERFDAVMAMLPPEWIERASKNFEEKMWDYVDRYFACAAEYDRRERRIIDSTALIEKECLQLHREAGGICSEELLQSMQSIIPQCPPAAAMSPQFPVFSQSGVQTTGCENGERVEVLIKERHEKLAELYEAKTDHNDLRGYSCLLPILECEELQDWTDKYPPEIRQVVEGFTVDDPYEACFAYLCLVESGSDLPWLGTPALAVLLAAGAKLPWSRIEPGIPEMYDLCYPEGEAHIHDLTAPEASARKADLYKLQYRPVIMPDPLNPEGPYRAVNIPQLVYWLSGIIMPRDVLGSDKIVKALIEAGVPAAEAPVWEQYLRLADEFQRKDTRAEMASLLPSLEDDAPEDHNATQEMAEQVRKLEGKLSDAWNALHDAEKAVKVKQAELEQAKAEARNERQELFDLRELVFYQTSGQEPDPAAQQGIQLPCKVKQRTVVFGGSDKWLKTIRPLLPNVNFIRREINPNADLIRRADVIWIQTNYIAHSYYYKVAEIARNSDVPIRYFTCTNAVRCAEQLVTADLQAQSR